MTGNIICGVSFHHSTARGSLKTCKKSSLVHQEAFSIKNGTVFCSYTQGHEFISFVSVLMYFLSR